MRIEHTIDVAAPAGSAFSQWLQYDRYPLFMENVHEVRKTARDRLHWRARRHGAEKEWDSQITINEPDMKLAWRDVGEAGNDGTIVVSKVDDAHCRIQMTMHAEAQRQPQEEEELSRRVQTDLQRFKVMMEQGSEKRYPDDEPMQNKEEVEAERGKNMPASGVLTNTPGSPKVPTQEEMAASPDADGQDNRIGLKQPAKGK